MNNNMTHCRHRTSLLATLVLIWSGPAQAQDKPMGVEKAVADAMSLVSTRFPKSKDLEEGWFTPWTMPPELRKRLLLPSEKEWHENQLDRLWANCSGIPEAELEGQLRRLLEAQAKFTQAQFEKEDPDAAKFFAKNGMLFARTMFLKTGRKPAVHPVSVELPLFRRVRADSCFLKAVKLRSTIEQRHKLAQTKLLSGLERKIAAAGSDEERDTLNQKYQESLEKLKKEQNQEMEIRFIENMLEAMYPEIYGKSPDEIVQRLARDYSAIRKFARMSYHNVDPKELKRAEKEASYIPVMNLVNIELVLVEKNARPTIAPDPTAEELKRLASELERSEFEVLLSSRKQELRKSSRSPEEDHAELIRDLNFGDCEFKVECQQPKYGDYCCTVIIKGPKSPTVQFNQYHSRLRNGNAIINIEVISTSKDHEWRKKQLDHFLSAMDKSTQPFRADE